VTTIDIGNPATNVVPGLARATFNIASTTGEERHHQTWVATNCRGWR